MKIKFFALLLFLTLGTLSANAQTSVSKVSKNTPQELPGGIRADQIYSGQTKIPSNTKAKKFPNSAPVTRPIKTASPALATGYQTKEGGYESYLLSGTSGVLASVAIFFGLLLVSVIFIIRNRKKNKSSRMRVREYKDKKFPTPQLDCYDGGIGDD